ncbi:MAG: glycosyltransferase family 2 protein [Lacibacter sp.]
MECSLVISTYNWPQALDLVLKSVLRQRVLPGEVIIADDGSAEETKQLIASYQASFPVPLIHMWHKDDGFRKTIILNKAYKAAKGEYIIQIDGDIIIHPDFIKDHLKFSEKGFYIKGSRGLLTKELTENVLKSKRINFSLLQAGIKSRFNITRLPLASRLLYGKPDNTRKVKGCNFAVWKSDFIAVNGYNNDVRGWGHEDIELAARLVNHGVKQRHLKLAAICFHIHHELASRHKEAHNLQSYYDVIHNKVKRCESGYDQV